jgi:hypothetical protein
MNTTMPGFTAENSLGAPKGRYLAAQRRRFLLASLSNCLLVAGPPAAPAVASIVLGSTF